MRIKRIVIILLITLLVILSACTSPLTTTTNSTTTTTTTTLTTPTTTSTLTSGEEIQPAPIHEVRIDFLQTEPVQVSVYIKMGLRDTCTKFHDLTTEQSGNTITIHVTTARPTGAICGQIYTFFETNVNLGSGFISGQTYTVQVNDQTTTFTMP